MIVGGPLIPDPAVGEIDVGGAAVVVAVDGCCADVLVPPARLVVDDDRPAAVLSLVPAGNWPVVVPVAAARVAEPDVRTVGAARVAVVTTFGGGGSAEFVDSRLDWVEGWLDSVEGRLDDVDVVRTVVLAGAIGAGAGGWWLPRSVAPPATKVMTAATAAIDVTTASRVRRRRRPRAPIRISAIASGRIAGSRGP